MPHARPSPRPIASRPGTIALRNVGRAPHTLAFPALAADTGVVPSGGSATLRLAGHERGAHEFECAVPGHAAAGMVGTLVVA